MVFRWRVGGMWVGGYSDIVKEVYDCCSKRARCLHLENKQRSNTTQAPAPLGDHRGQSRESS